MTRDGVLFSLDVSIGQSTTSRTCSGWDRGNARVLFTRDVADIGIDWLAVSAMIFLKIAVLCPWSYPSSSTALDRRRHSNIHRKTFLNAGGGHVLSAQRWASL